MSNECMSLPPLNKNGGRIFEGDVIDFPWHGMGSQRFEIRWNETCAMFCAIPVKKHKDIWPIGLFGYEKQMAVIGNIHDNPEILEG